MLTESRLTSAGDRGQGNHNVYRTPPSDDSFSSVARLCHDPARHTRSKFSTKQTKRCSVDCEEHWVMNINTDCAFKAKLPYNFIPDYQSYKKSAAILVGWRRIDSSSASRSRSRSLPSVKELMHMAQMVKENHSTAPTHVLQALESSIKKRRRITDFFNSLQNGERISEDEITRSHEHLSQRKPLGILSWRSNR